MNIIAELLNISSHHSYMCEVIRYFNAPMPATVRYLQWLRTNIASIITHTI